MLCFSALCLWVCSIVTPIAQRRLVIDKDFPVRRTLDVIDIIRSWWSAWNPSPQQRELAEYRTGICAACPALRVSRVQLIDGERRVEQLNAIPADMTSDLRWTCGECGCPIPKKVYTSRGPSGCPRSRWKF